MMYGGREGMKEKYGFPEIEVIWLDDKDLVRTSGLEDDEVIPMPAIELT